MNPFCSIPDEVLRTPTREEWEARADRGRAGEFTYCHCATLTRLDDGVRAEAKSRCFECFGTGRRWLQRERKER